MPSGNTHPGLSLAGSRQRLRLQVSRCGFTWFSASFFSFTSSPPPSPLLVSRVGVKRAIILMHLFMGVIKISARQRVRESSCAALNEPPTRSLSRSGWSIIGRAISSRNTDSNREDGIAEGRWTKRSQLRPVIVACVRGLAISVPLWYGRMRGRGVEKNIRARRCIVYPRTFYPAGEEKGGDVR